MLLCLQGDLLCILLYGLIIFFVFLFELVLAHLCANIYDGNHII